MVCGKWGRGQEDFGLRIADLRLTIDIFVLRGAKLRRRGGDG